VDILRSLDKSSAVADYDVYAFRSWPGGGYYNIAIELFDGSTLYAREYIDGDERNYSFHWQDENANLLVRWDNAPHHPEMTTFPHHRHDAATVRESSPTTLGNVLESIEKTITDGR
jgi:hypothetical protein